jgi:hypothetical protein
MFHVQLSWCIIMCHVHVNQENNVSQSESELWVTLYSSCGPISSCRQPSIILRRTTLFLDGTSAETFAILDHGHDTASHCARVASTTRRQFSALEFPAIALPQMDTFIFQSQRCLNPQRLLELLLWNGLR